MTPTPRFSVVGLVVGDMSTSLAFYRKLGLDIPAEAGGQPHVEATLPGGMRIAWDTAEIIRSFDPEWSPATGGHRISLAFECDSPDHVDAMYNDLVGGGYDGHLEPWDAVWEQRYAVVHDPDANAVDLFAPL